MDFGIWSILPPLLAIVLAFITKNVLLSLIVAVFVGATMLAGNPLVGLVDVFGNYMIPKIAEPFNAGCRMFFNHARKRRRSMGIWRSGKEQDQNSEARTTFCMVWRFDDLVQ